MSDEDETLFFTPDRPVGNGTTNVPPGRLARVGQWHVRPTWGRVALPPGPGAPHILDAAPGAAPGPGRRGRSLLPLALAAVAVAWVCLGLTLGCAAAAHPDSPTGAAQDAFTAGLMAAVCRVGDR